MKKYFIFVILILVIIVVGCANNKFEDKVTQVEDKVAEIIDETGKTAVTEEISAEEAEDVDEVRQLPSGSCNDSRECEQGKNCINNVCSTVEDLYRTECPQKCNFNRVEVSTSDGETYVLNRGQSSYTAAGALAWKLLSGPDYCPDEEIIVPIELEKINYGEILNTQIVTVKVGETSEVITHPTSKKVSFTLTVESVNEVCSEK